MYAGVARRDTTFDNAFDKPDLAVVPELHIQQPPFADFHKSRQPVYIDLFNFEQGRLPTGNYKDRP